MNTSLQNELLLSLEEAVPSEFHIVKRAITKNNGTDHLGICLAGEEEEAGCSPVVYLEHYSARAESGEDVGKLAREMAHILLTPVPEGIDPERFKDLGRVRERIIYRLINRSLNAPSLPDIPGRPFLDLYVSYGIALTGEEAGATAIAGIREDLRKLWGISEEELFALASVNTPRIFPDRFVKLSDYLNSLMPGSPEPFPDCGSCYVLTNSAEFYGASAVLYTPHLRELAERTGGDVFLIPSSVHEMIAFTGEHPAEGIGELIPLVNSEMVNREEVLGDRLYVYRRGTGEIEAADCGSSGE